MLAFQQGDLTRINLAYFAVHTSKWGLLRKTCQGENLLVWLTLVLLMVCCEMPVLVLSLPLVLEYHHHWWPYITISPSLVTIYHHITITGDHISPYHHHWWPYITISPSLVTIYHHITITGDHISPYHHHWWPNLPTFLRRVMQYLAWALSVLVIGINMFFVITYVVSNSLGQLQKSYCCVDRPWIELKPVHIGCRSRLALYLSRVVVVVGLSQGLFFFLSWKGVQPTGTGCMVKDECVRIHKLGVSGAYSPGKYWNLIPLIKCLEVHYEALTTTRHLQVANVTFWGELRRLE